MLEAASPSCSCRLALAVTVSARGRGPALAVAVAPPPGVAATDPGRRPSVPLSRDLAGARGGAAGPVADAPCFRARVHGA